MTGGFIEDYANPNADPLAEASVGFDYDAVYHGLGEMGDWEDDDFSAKMAQALSVFLRTVTDVDLRRKDAEKHIARRCLAYVWVVNPALIQGSPSLTKIAEALGVSPATMASHTGAVSRALGIRNRAQAHAGNWKEAKDAA